MLIFYREASLTTLVSPQTDRLQVHNQQPETLQVNHSKKEPAYVI